MYFFIHSSDPMEIAVVLLNYFPAYCYTYVQMPQQKSTIACKKFNYDNLGNKKIYSHKNIRNTTGPGATNAILG